jgi:para-nitrobenzyl esterase
LRAAQGAQAPDSDALALLGPAKAVVSLSVGKLEGRKDWEVYSFKGVPYAQPPVGPLRWEHPRPVQPWAGTQRALEYGADCVQLADGTPVGKEDCLFLNVWTTSLSATAKRPVMLFVHGGSYIQGSGTSFGPLDIYIGDELSKRGVVVVTINYRLGALGFLPHPGFASVNHGLMDQVQALTWVQEHIVKFGGDPTNVTLFGESAGAMSTCSLLATPAARGKFHRAIIQSGGCDVDTLASQHPIARADAANWGCEEADVAAEAQCLRQLSAEHLIKGQRRPEYTVNFSALPYRPVTGDDTLPLAPLDAISRGEHNAVPTIIGSNKNEVPGLIYKDFDNQAAWAAQIRAAFPGDAAFQMVSGYYSKARYGSYADALGALHTDISFACSDRTVARTLVAAQEQPVFRYMFDALGAFHGAELFYVFQRLGLLGGALQDNMGQYWTSFAKGAAPKTTKKSPAWTPYDLDTERLQVLASTISGIERYKHEQCDVLDAATAR